MRLTLLLSFLLIAPIASAQSTDTLTTDDDAFTMFVDSTLSVAAPGLLTNDTVVTGDSLRILLVSGPSNGTLEIGAGGSFVYAPNTGFSGIDEFTYMLETLPLQHLEVDTSETRLDLDMSVFILSIERKDEAEVRLSGTASLYLDPVVNPAETVQLYDMELVNEDSLDLEFDYGLLVGNLKAHADADSFRINLSQRGAPVSMNGDSFLQQNNKLSVLGTVDLEATGIIGGQIPDEPVIFDTETPELDASGTLSIVNDEITVTVPIALADTFNVVEDAADVGLILSGTVVSRGPLRMPAESNVATVVITVDPKTSTSVDDELPIAFALSQNYPNPFNPVTTIVFSIPSSDNVSLKVFDTLGREVATLIDGFMAQGRHDVQFDAGLLPSGMYLYRLEAGGKTDVKRMVVLK